MERNSQHEFHPDAERLNAFAEQALGERERGQVLEHLAVCPRCRQVVTLARESALDAEVVAPAAAASRVARRQGSRIGAAWRFAWIPAAALAATAALAVYVHVQHVERSAEMAKNQAPDIAQTAVSAPAPQERPAEAAPSAAPARRKPAPRAVRPTPKPAPSPEPPPALPEPPAQEASASAPAASQSVTVTAPSFGEQAAPAAGAMMRRRAVEEPAEEKIGGPHTTPCRPKLRTRRKSWLGSSVKRNSARRRDACSPPKRVRRQASRAPQAPREKIAASSRWLLRIRPLLRPPRRAPERQRRPWLSSTLTAL